MNNTFEKTLISFVVVIVAIFIAVTAYQMNHSKAPSLGGSAGEAANLFFKTATSTKETVLSSGSSRILATSTSRSWAVISNNSAFPIFCTENGDQAATNNGGTLINASSTLTLSGANTYGGSMQCIAQGSNAAIWVEAVQ